MEAELQDIDENGSWTEIYQDIRQQSCDLPCKVAKLPENKTRNRYRDVSPFDHSRIHLQLGANDYINASLITVEEAQRKYILTQGPLPTTCGHFWEMVWEQRSRGVVMLNRVIEKGSIKCAQYWPQKEAKDAVFEDTNFKVTFVSEDVKSYYTVRQLELENLCTGETREILHFHYTTWPDFGVPESPASFLNFLYKVRESGCLNSDQGPVVVHCSAGIGRSGTFCLVDTCLILMSMRRDPSSVRIRDVLLEMRRHRMGLIQTADQLRFSYLAVIEGAKYIDGDKTLQDSWKEISYEEDEPPEFSPPPLPPPRDHKAQPIILLGSSKEPELRQRTISYGANHVDDPAGVQDTNSTPSHHVHPYSQEAKTGEPQCPKRETSKIEDVPEAGTWSPFLTNVCLYTAVALSAYACYRAYFH
ncbi:tyrosine-protein phosphatase non-receptor type 1-like [Periophthalmus magnuspinnatus]|uniref:Tyrosine-protein phosphatase non-receptor type n=1 Tax=Periophthalmus magnuspinnatus TaxID=409849 RepID=A0A3B4ATE5_9GOBI|nr:tyrosine-protein phosphatase non-receptor type 1-like [Periophthalmus magnuspinnatus]